ncbi:uncharacterized protein LOC110967929 isoform X2 [Acanthochromis polyacanthus]|uniref:uncharacterized protein LOC110967929 isoform X2 n=1 Tax=Acanthochromis polyacanthus TaxID=80966 RepID=UPI0022346EA1|nr:uncharacterized protein LOC110967929 isoform X2 [Acanthochromis polyacanthus]
MVPNRDDGTDLKPLRGKTLPLFVDPEVEAPDLLKQAVKKMRTFNKDMQEGPYVLLYADCSEVVHVPGSEKPFKLDDYKRELGRPYGRITFFICLETHFKGAVGDTSDSDGDSEIIITSRSTAEFNRADTVVFEPRNQSTPKHKAEDERDPPGHSATIQPGQILLSDTEDMDPPESNPAKLSCYGKYTDLYAPSVEEEDEELVAVSVENLQHTAVEEMNITLPDVVANLSLPIDHTKIENAASLDALQECIMRHSTMLQTAGCLRHVAAVGEKKEVVADYLRWYIIDRNSSVIDRFRDGLSALQFLTALRQHPSLLTPVLCHSAKRLTGLELERLFKPDLSPSGSNRSLKESQTLAYWADYLLDCEEGETAVSVEDVLMFATGLTSLPPSGLEPLPQIWFLDDSPFPMANTCSNLLKLPLLDSYSVFKSQMDFGIQNSPGFGCF